MRIGIIGAGAIGGSLGALLARGGHEVQFAARGEHLAAIQRDGLQLSGAFGNFTATVDAAEALAPGAELIIVATKAQDARGAIREHRAAIDGQCLLIVQNGLDGIAIAAEEAPGCEVVGGLAVYASSYLKPGEITVTTGGTLYVGGAEGSHDAARELATLFNEVLPTVHSANFVGAQWTKLILNQVNALPAITGLSVQEVVAHGGLRRVMTASMREAVRVAAASGIRFAPLQGLNDALLRGFARLPLWAGQALPSVMSARIGSVPNPGSTLQSIRRGQLTEIDYLNGAVVRAAEAIGAVVRAAEATGAVVRAAEATGAVVRAAEAIGAVAPAAEAIGAVAPVAESIGAVAPVNAALVGLVHEVERSGEFLRPSEVVARVAATVAKLAATTVAARVAASVAARAAAS